MSTLSVVLPLYYRNEAVQLKAALHSIFMQTRLPEEVLVVADGPLPVQLEQVVDSFVLRAKRLNLPIKVNYQKFEQNEGLGEAMRKAALVAKGDFIARMDADDICLPDRFEKQMKCFENDGNLSVVGGQIAEFDGDVKNIIGKRIVPLEHKEIVNYMKSRNGMNHVTTILKKKDLIDSGNYQPLEWFEDYCLWVRMIQHGCKFKNISDDVVLVRAGKAQADRRGGWAYFKNEVFLFKCLLSQGFITKNRFCINIIERGFVRLLMTSSIRSWFYKNVLR